MTVALTYSGVPNAGDPERMSTLLVNPPYATGQPGFTTCQKPASGCPLSWSEPTNFVTLAFQVEGLIFWFVLFAWSGLGAAFGPVVLCLLYYKKTTGAGVAAGMLAGFLTSIIWVLAMKEHTYDLYEALPGFIVGGVVTLLVSVMTFKTESQH